MRRGSILGSLLFIRFINGIATASNVAELIITNLVSKHKKMDVLYATIHIELAKISQWFKLDKLSLNILQKSKLSLCSNK